MTYDETDVRVRLCGSVVTLESRTEAGREWMHERIATEPWQWLGTSTLVVDVRFAPVIIHGMREDGLGVQG